MRVKRIRDLRASQRRPFNSPVLVSWEIGSGDMKTVRATCTDLSDQGARIECEPAIECRTSVYVQAPAFGMMGQASVRYCRRSGMKHVIGLLFNAPASQADQGRKYLIESQPGVEKRQAHEC
jgi:hypothetical protein